MHNPDEVQGGDSAEEKLGRCDDSKEKIPDLRRLRSGSDPGPGSRGPGVEFIIV